MVQATGVIGTGLRGQAAPRERGTQMQYVILLDWRTEATGEERDGALMRRAGWSYPDGLNVIAESWTASSSPAVVVIAEADDFAPLMELDMTGATCS